METKEALFGKEGKTVVDLNVIITLLTEQFGVTSKADKFYFISILVKPNQQEVALYMTFHVVLVIAGQRVGVEVRWDCFAVRQLTDDFQKGVYLVGVVFYFFEVLLELRSLAYCLHAYSIEAMKLSILEMSTTPASFSLSASFIASSVVLLGMSAVAVGSGSLSIAMTLTPFIRLNILFRLSNIVELSTCNVKVAIRLKCLCSRCKCIDFL